MPACITNLTLLLGWWVHSVYKHSTTSRIEDHNLVIKPLLLEEKYNNTFVRTGGLSLTGWVSNTVFWMRFDQFFLYIPRITKSLDTFFYSIPWETVQLIVITFFSYFINFGEQLNPYSLSTIFKQQRGIQWPFNTVCAHLRTVFCLL